jgi:hypothetical protein
VIRRILVALVSVAFLLAGLSIAQNQKPAAGGDDDPPVRLKKKNRAELPDKPKEDEPKADERPKDPPKKDEPKKDEPKADEQPAGPGEGDMDESEVLNRVGKNMRTSEDRLDRGELNDSTRQVQEDILKDLDDLINREKNGGGGGDDQPQQNQNDQQNRENKQNQGQKGQDSRSKVGMAYKKRSLKGSGQQQAQRKGGKKAGGQDKGEQVANAGQKPGEKPQANNSGQKPGENPGQVNPQPNPQGGGGGQSVGPESSKLAEIYKEEWGHLPEALRAPMDAHSREKFMAKYNDAIKQYYITVAEKSRKKD